MCTMTSPIPSPSPARSQSNLSGTAPSVINSQNNPASTVSSSQQSTLVGVRTARGSDAFHAAIQKFKARLSGPHLTEFKNMTYDDLCSTILQIQQEQEENKKIMNLSRIQSCLEAMQQFGKTVEVFLNTADMLAFIWGPIKFLLLTASNFADSFETLLDAYEHIGEQLPLLQDYEDLFHGSPYMLHVLELMYLDILGFHQHALKFFSGKLWHRFFRSMWKDFGTRFDGILKSLRRHKELVESRATIAQYRRYKEDVTELKKKIEELILQERMKKMKAVKEWLAVGSRPQQDHAGFQRIRAEFPSTGRWISKHEYFKEWLGMDVPPTPIIWLFGIPGAGKTVLTSNIIEDCKNKTGFRTSYFYCHHEDQSANTAVGVLRGLVDQLLDEYPSLLPQCYTRQTTSGEPSLRSLPLAKKLMEDFCATVPKMFLIIDGIDECEQMERKQLLEFLMGIVSQADNDEPGKLRVLFVSQEYADIKRVLHSSSATRVVPKSVSLLQQKDNEGDIQTYVKGWVDRIANQHAPFEAELVDYLRNLTISRAKGMFLYAKLVMENLYHQPTRGDLMNAIKHENFPDGLKGAYERIVTRIRASSHPEEWQKAKKLLGWMVCCKRQLTWKEIQVALSIDGEEQCIDWDDRRLRKHIHDICGSLVKVDDDRVSLVHSTAKYYITQCTQDIHRPSVECELATLCLQYLVFPCFSVENNVDENTLRQSMIEGYFAFQDYAIAKWFYHINAFVESGKDFLECGIAVEDHLDAISAAIDTFLDQYHTENFHDNIVDECRTKCQIFQDQDFYEDLVALTSHIFQKSRFDAKHKISIGQLEKALVRNRKLVEDLPPKLNPADLDKFHQFYDGERRYKCTRITCMYFSEGFKDAKSRKRHVNIHDRPFQCEVPDCLGAEGFANSKDLEKHTRGFHPEISDLADRFNTVTAKKGKADHTCTICGKSFTRNQIKQDHMKSHRGERPHECPECGKAFTRKNDLTRHQKLHNKH
ncbi:unnamed protein product [Periconia digitata]|uniref:C2H2-type domain-containing protein n=1 Tax=Periconia digitata TaxID=1303443 RepID=A0A9W4UCM9_9PLEO|nr:unnamed protein product [Periconia digitata]